MLTEAVLTLGLVSVILGTASGARNIGFNGALAVGGYIGLVSVWAAPVTGASMNPVRSFAPELVAGDLSEWWVYLVGPLIGALVAVGFEWILKGGPTAAGADAAQGILDTSRSPAGGTIGVRRSRSVHPAETSVTVPSLTGGPPAFHLLAKPTGAICNLDCAYCFFLSKEMLYPGSRFRMADELLETYIRQLIEAHRTPEVTIAWQGGEPTLMGCRLLPARRSSYVEKYRRPGMTIEHTIQTNGTLIDDEWAAFFKEHNFLVGISIDGPRGDARCLSRGQGRRADLRQGDARAGVPEATRRRVQRADHAPPRQRRPSRRGLSLPARRVRRALHPVHSDRRATATPRSTCRSRTRPGARAGARGAVAVVARPPALPPGGLLVTDRSVTAAQYGQFLIGVFEEWVRRDIGEVYVQMFDVALANWYGEPSGLCVFSKTCGTALALEHNGDLYSCDHFVEQSYKLGNINETHMIELVASDQQRKFGQDKFDTLPQYCLDCDVRFACHGGCPKDRFISDAGR